MLMRIGSDAMQMIKQASKDICNLRMLPAGWAVAAEAGHLNCTIIPPAQASSSLHLAGLIACCPWPAPCICVGVLLRSSIALQARQQVATNGSFSDMQPGSRVQPALSATNSTPAAAADSAAQAQTPGTTTASPEGTEAHATASEQTPAAAQPDRAAGVAAEQGFPAGDAQPWVAAGEAGSQLSQPAAMASKLPRVHIGKRRSFDSMNDIEGMSPPSSRQRSEAWQVQRQPTVP